MQNKWIDPRFFIWLIPLGSLIWAGSLLVLAYTPFMVYFTAEGVGVGSGKKLAITLIMIFFFLGLGYMFSGIVRFFFIELREKFIAYKVLLENEVYIIKGYYFKKDKFNKNEILSVEDYPIIVRPGLRKLRNFTILSWSPQTVLPNYKILLVDGRVFYLPGDMTNVLGLVDVLRKVSVKNISGPMTTSAMC